MYILDIEKLEAGDIFLTRSSSRDSKLIRQISQCDYSHAIIYVGASSCIESDGLGVQSQNIQRLLFENESDILVLRVKDDSFKKMLSEVIVFARQKIGTEYSTTEAKLARLEKNLSAKETNRQFCTRFVAQAYQNAGIQIVANPDYCSPNDIQGSKLLSITNNVLRAALKLEIDFAKSENPLEKQRDIHNFIFENSRIVSEQDIQTFEQLSKYVLEYPDKEKDIVEIIEKSGYLDMWKGDVERNPWYYDYKEFLKHYANPKQRKEVGYFFATTEKETRERYYQTLETVKFGYSFYGQKYFEIQIELYKKLIELSETRELVGILALAK
ncbi:MAG: hypothetical protein EAZ95_03115 [Bacteroidetes bacterium]|nr:MAG: hypothetical protein EAZ95_03115 [Bacteroidota bacterium]